MGNITLEINADRLYTIPKGELAISRLRVGYSLDPEPDLDNANVGRIFSLI